MSKNYYGAVDLVEGYGSSASIPEFELLNLLDEVEKSFTQSGIDNPELFYRI
jgi:hypothetical protein